MVIYILFFLYLHTILIANIGKYIYNVEIKHQKNGKNHYF